MGRTKEAVKARTQRRRRAKKSLLKNKKLASVPIKDSDSASEIFSESSGTSERKSSEAHKESPIKDTDSASDIFSEYSGTSEREGSEAPKESPLDKKLRLLKQMLNPKKDPYYTVDDPLARAFCEWRVAKRTIQLLEKANTSKKWLVSCIMCAFTLVGLCTTNSSRLLSTLIVLYIKITRCDDSSFKKNCQAWSAAPELFLMYTWDYTVVIQLVTLTVHITNTHYLLQI